MECHGFEIVGLPDTSIREAKERVKTAIKNSGYELQSRKIVVNLAPADTKKEGSFFDLPIAIGVLNCTEYLENEQLEDIAFIGELSLDGKINKVDGVLPMCIEAKRLGIETIVVPKENAKEASVVEGIEVLGAESLNQVINYLNSKVTIPTYKTDINNLFSKQNKYLLDFSEVKGQENIKRALEIAAARWAQCTLNPGRLGSGKTMLSRRIPSILPDLSFEEALETTKIHSIAGVLTKQTPLITARPFRAPHHTISPSSLVGGGRIPKPGEISLAHNGVLFLDELPEFNKSTLEVMRAPIEDGIVNISRVNASLTYPCNFMLVASMNPCPCGFYGLPDKECNCSPQSIQKYMGRISGPLLDRIDIQVEVTPVKYEKLQNENEAETSEQIKERENKARQIQLERYKNSEIYSNSQLTPKLIEQYCKFDSKSKKILQKKLDTVTLNQ